MAAVSVADSAGAIPEHSSEFRRRRFLNWFPMGLTYALLYMGRYNLTIAKIALGDLMTKEDFGFIFGVGTITYAIAFLLNGPLTDRFGGRKALLAAAVGSGFVNLAMGFFLQTVVAGASPDAGSLKLGFALLYALNMYFQSFGAVGIVKVNASWFHVRERGAFSGIFGTMISSGIFFAFTVNGWLLSVLTKGDVGVTKIISARWVFFAPGMLLLTMAVVEALLLRDKPSDAGHEDFDTGDASSGDDGDASLLAIMRKVMTNPVILTVAFIEFCTGVLRNGVMHWYPIYAKEVLALPKTHYMNRGSWASWQTIVPFFVVSLALFFAAKKLPQKAQAPAKIIGALLFLLPFLQGGWGGLLMVAGIVGGNVAGRVSDIFFQSRRAPAAGGLYGVLVVCAAAMYFALGMPANIVGGGKGGLQPGDKVLEVNGTKGLSEWVAVKRAFQCVPAQCSGNAKWSAKSCKCSSKGGVAVTEAKATIAMTVERAGKTIKVEFPDPAYKRDKAGTLKPKLRAGDRRKLKVQPKPSMSPYWLGAIVFIISLSVIGTHGLLSGTATMDFGGHKGAATAVAMIDGFVYLGTAVESFSLGPLTSKSWSYWPIFLLPFGVLGFLGCLRIWNASPGGKGNAAKA